MTSAPTVSVVIAAFNAEATLGAQLAALARQSLPLPFEVLVCDNGSSDRTIDVAREWAAEALPQLKILDASARRGPAAARNCGARAATSSLLLFCDADDVVADDWIATMYSALQLAEFVAGGFSFTLLNRSAIGQREWEDPLFHLSFLRALPATSASNMGVRAEVFEEVGGFDESLRTAEDIDLCWRVQLAGHSLHACPTAIVHRRRRADLWGVYRQYFHYGRGERILRHKYADVAAAISQTRSAATDAEGATADVRHAVSRPHPARLVRKVMTKVHRFRGPGDLAFVARRTGYALGARFGAYDPTSVRVPVPSSWRIPT